MILEDEICEACVSVQNIHHEHFSDIEVSVLRLDKVHPVVSGNKWFKLKYYLQEANEQHYTCIATFGGAFSNHILATAYACYKQNLPCIGYIRGEKPKRFSQTLLDAQALDMQFEFLSREAYSKRQTIMNTNPSVFFIPEGGYGITGAKGAAGILMLVPNISTYRYIVCSAGTGTMLAGIINASQPNQQCIGISVMKNNFCLENESRCLINESVANRMSLLHHYDFGGYAKFTQELIDFMNTVWTRHRVPLDFVYTGKAFYALQDLVKNKYFVPGSKILFIHSGGLQGNRSLAKGTLKYQ